MALGRHCPAHCAAPWPVILPLYQTNRPNLQFIEPAPVGNSFYRLHKP